MKLSLSSTSASSEAVDLLTVPLASSEEPAAGFGDLMAELLPDSDEEPVDSSASDSDPSDAEAAAAQAVVDLMAWLVRTPPPVASTREGGDPLPDDAGSEDEGLGVEGRPGPGSDSAFVAGSTPKGAGTATADSARSATGKDVPLPESTAPGAEPAPLPLDPLRVSDPTAAAQGEAEATTGEDGLVDPAMVGNLVAAVVPVRIQPPSGTMRTRIEGRGEIFAVTSRPGTAPAEIANEATGKNFLNVDGESDEEQASAVGIAVAERDGNMPALSLPTPNTSARPDSGAVAAVLEVTASNGDQALPTPAASAKELDLAHTAVAAVTKAIERAEAAPRTAVNLQFSIGDSDLVVRIEHRADEVRATFRTDSGELRAALSREWQSAVSGGSDHALRRVEPVFTSAASSDDDRSAGDGNSSWSQQRNAGREAQGETGAPFSSLLRRTVPNVSAPAASVRPGLHSTALHLQTFA